ncbi:MAG: protein-L-isoaspartate(D-aspartate) O-methyltransferase [Bacteroidota bacterium]
MRKQLLRSLQQKGIQDERVLAAMWAVPRHFFLEKAFEEWAYQDKAFPIGNEQTISQPYTVAYQTKLLEIQKRDKVMEIGTGSGYQAAILGALGARVFTIERQEALYKQAKRLFAEHSFGNIRTFFRDGSKGLPEYAPFDKIIVTAGAGSIPPALKTQLRVGGILVIPVGDSKVQYMLKITRLSADHYQEEQLAAFRFVPLLKGLNRY